MLEFVKFMLDGNIPKLVVLLIIIFAFIAVVKNICEMIPNIVKSAKKDNNNFFISEKNVDKKFVEELKKSGNKIK